MSNYQKSKKEVKIIYSMRLAGHLMKEGCMVLGMEKNKVTNDRRMVFFFEDTDKLDREIDNYNEEKRLERTRRGN